MRFEIGLVRWLVRGCALGVLASTLTAQVTIQNPKHREVPEQRAQMLHQIVCRVVSDELHLHRDKATLPVILILGEPEQRIVADEDAGTFRIYLKRWDEPSFAISDLQLVLQRAMVRKHWQPMVTEVVRRFQQVAPVRSEELNATSRPAHPSAATRPFPDLEHQHSSSDSPPCRADSK